MLHPRVLLERLEQLERIIRELKEQLVNQEQVSQRASLYGAWKEKLPADLDVDAMLTEIRSGWTRKLKEAP
ncbi:MAG: hypothetical protein NZO41_04030 [Candidatus Bipolaricaulota bacterium]|nr:hypothetical protein [Candidatus Bipolaricaulota bacterium]MDW8140785.1 hypothetical protein [Candidatus Bipolaricaulota bacterium]